MKISLKKYYAWFLLFCFLMTCISGVLATVLPRELSLVFMVLPYLVSMIAVLYLFLRQHRRAPTVEERKRFTLSLNLLFWLFNLSGFFLGLLWTSFSEPEIWQYTMKMLFQPATLMIIGLFFIVIALPLIAVTFWFYGKQAERMALKMFGHR